MALVFGPKGMANHAAKRKLEYLSVERELTRLLESDSAFGSFSEAQRMKASEAFLETLLASTGDIAEGDATPDGAKKKKFTKQDRPNEMLEELDNTCVDMEALRAVLDISEMHSVGDVDNKLHFEAEPILAEARQIVAQNTNETYALSLSDEYFEGLVMHVVRRRRLEDYTPEELLHHKRMLLERELMSGDCVTTIMDIAGLSVGLILSLISKGLGTVAKKVVEVATKANKAILFEVKNTVVHFSNGDILKGVLSIFKVIYEAVDLGTVFSILWDELSIGDFITTCASLVVEIVAIIATGGLAIAVKVAAFAVDATSLALKVDIDLPEKCNLEEADTAADIAAQLEAVEAELAALEAIEETQAAEVEGGI